MWSVPGKSRPWQQGWRRGSRRRTEGDAAAEPEGAGDLQGAHPESGERSWQGGPGREAGPRGGDDGGEQGASGQTRQR